MRLLNWLCPDYSLHEYTFGTKAKGYPVTTRQRELSDSSRLRVEAMTVRETPGALHRWYQEAPEGVTVTQVRVLDLDLLPVAGRLPRPRNIMLLKQGTRTE